MTQLSRPDCQQNVLLQQTESSRITKQGQVFVVGFIIGLDESALMSHACDMNSQVAHLSLMYCVRSYYNYGTAYMKWLQLSCDILPRGLTWLLCDMMLVTRELLGINAAMAYQGGYCISLLLAEARFLCAGCVLLVSDCSWLE